jgi:hypothetical protein
MHDMSARVLAFLMVMALITMPIVVAADDDGDHMGRLLQVNCNKEGQTITKALRQAQPGDTIQVTGTCKETVTMTTDRVTLDGGGSAILQGSGGGPADDASPGLLNIVGAHGVEIRGLTVQHSPGDGINGRQGAAFAVDDVRLLHNADDGLEATESSTVRLHGACEMSHSGDSGIALSDGSSALFIDVHVTMTQNATAGMFLIGTSTAGFRAGMVDTQDNMWGILALGHSSLTLGSSGPSILAQHNGFDGILVADTSDLRLDGGKITVSHNGRAGLWFGGTAGLGNIAGEIVSENNAEGMHAEDVSRISQLIAGKMTVRNNTTGIVGINGSNVRISGGGTITDNDTDIDLIFGSLGTFEGNTIGTIRCDETSRVHGDTGVMCPHP